MRNSRRVSGGGPVAAAVALAITLTGLGGCADEVSPRADRMADRIALAPPAGVLRLLTFDAPGETDPWRVINDTVMGGRSSSRMDVTDGGTAVFSGTVSLENNGGFAHTRSLAAPFDLSAYAGIAVRVRGDGKTYELTLKTDRAFDGIIYQADFAAPADAWTEIRLPFADFVPTYHGRGRPDRPPLDPSAIATIGFLIAYKQAGPFQLEIDWIGAYP